MLSIDVADDGTLSVEIADAKGELRSYAVAFPPSPEFAVVLDRLDTGDRHAVVRIGPSSWRCSCGDSTYRHGRGRRSDCKHIRAARGLWLLRENLLAQATAEPISSEAV